MFRPRIAQKSVSTFSLEVPFNVKRNSGRSGYLTLGNKDACMHAKVILCMWLCIFPLEVNNSYVYRQPIYCFYKRLWFHRYVGALCVLYKECLPKLYTSYQRFKRSGF